LTPERRKQLTEAQRRYLATPEGKAQIEAYRKKLWAKRGKELYQRYKFSRYGVTREQYDEILCQQKGRCGACHAALLSSRRTHLDHCHKTGRVRGILCGGCNCALGHLEDSLQRIVDLALYLEADLKKAGVL
jgi:hypothetical protein